MYYNHLNTGRPVDEGADRYFKYRSNYLDIRNDPLYPFGFGLSYTTFEYGTPRLSSSTLKQGGTVTATVTVKNTGNKDADEIVQCYIHDIFASVARPVKELKGFKRIHLKAGESQDVSFVIGTEQLSYYDNEGNVVIEPGEFDIMTGPNSRDVKKVRLNLPAE